jgi:hypothetical protein
VKELQVVEDLASPTIDCDGEKIASILGRGRDPNLIAHHDG